MGKLNLKIKEEKDSGFSTVVSGRFTNKDGRYNVKRKGVNIFIDTVGIILFCSYRGLNLLGFW